MPIFVEPDPDVVESPDGLQEWQIDLDGLIFGGTSGMVSKDTLVVHDIVESTAEWLTEDAANPAGDGTRPGRDRLPGGSLQIVLTAKGDDAAAALAAMRQLRAVWQDRRWREPGVVTPLRFRLPGRETVRVYGRPRRWAGSLTDVVFGRVPITAEFEMLDPLFYGDVEQVLSIPAVATGAAGGVSLGQFHYQCC